MNANIVSRHACNTGYLIFHYFELPVTRIMFPRKDNKTKPHSTN